MHMAVINSGEYIEGTNGDDTLTGTQYNDTVIGGGGADTLIGNDGNDSLDGAGLFEGDSGGVVTHGMTLTDRAQYYLERAGNTLVDGLGGDTGFGEQVLQKNDDDSSAFIDISSVLERSDASSLNFFGKVFTGFYLNTNGNITFSQALSEYTPSGITAGSANPIIAPFWADVDTRDIRSGDSVDGAAAPSVDDDIYWDLDALNGVVTVTWHDVGYYGAHTDKTNAFQLQLVDRGAGDFDIIYRYENIDWTTGDASGGHEGLGGVVARAGFSSGTGTAIELDQSGNQDAILSLDETLGNTNRTGVYIYEVRNGAISYNNDDSIDGGAGDDTLHGGFGNDTMDGGDGSDTAWFSGDASAYTFGTFADGSLQVAGLDGFDVLRNIEFLQFDDEIISLDDVLLHRVTGIVVPSTEGDDSADGGVGADTLEGGAGDDTLTGAEGDDSVDGGFGNDSLDGGRDNDSLVGGVGDDTLKGFTGNDTLYGDEGNDSILAGSGDDNLFGGIGNDYLSGYAGNDFIDCGDGNDTVKAGAGDDTILGGAGKDVLNGNEGADSFVFTSLLHSVTGAADRINDFEVGTDTIVLSGFGYSGVVEDHADAGELRLVYSVATDRTYLRDDYSDFEIALTGDYRGTLSDADFVFV